LPDSTEIGIEGVRLIHLAPHADDRGSLTEVFRQEWLAGAPPMVQANLSRSRAGVLRGLHFHRRQADYWCVLAGRAFVGLLDLRAGSPTERRAAGIAIDAEAERVGLYLPPGVAHGFYAETEVLLQYLVDAYYSGEDELGLAWDDPSVGIEWPATEPVLSDRDRANPPLAEVLRDPPRFTA
jgi:dTDP-4-dehydrorhamnose 3,5-epimerase